MHIIDSKQYADSFLKILYDDIKSSEPYDRFITVDTEFIRENLKIPLLCLIQIATYKNSFIIDPLSIDISFLEIIFADSALLKVFHSATQDVEVLATFNININNLYDTQLYEMVLNNKEYISYQSIVNKYLNKKLKKSHSMSNWENRPLTKKQLHYSIEDVTYLRDVYKKQRQELIRLNRLGWLEDELLNITQKITSNQNDSSKDIINEKNISIYNELLQWRDSRANEKNIDAEFVVKKEIIKAICKKGKDFIINMKNSRQVKSEDLKDFLYFAEKKAENIDITKKIPCKNIALNLLKVILEIRSQENNITPSIIATSADLEKILNCDKNIKCLSGWRKDIFGNDAINFLDGNLSISMNDSKVKIDFIKQ